MKTLTKTNKITIKDECTFVKLHIMEALIKKAIKTLENPKSTKLERRKAGQIIDAIYNALCK